MKNLYQDETLAEVHARLAAMTPAAERQWGTMTVAQMLTHCSIGLEWAVGERVPPPLVVEPQMAETLKRKVLGNDDPMRRNLPAPPGTEVRDDRDFEAERVRLGGLLGRFSSSGPAGCTTHEHTYFGKMTGEEWASVMYKHVDHHLRQFGA
jgi:hypothetical protein